MNQMPDFILIGAMKSATTTLHAQLKRQEGFFMTEWKEPAFFSHDEIYAQGLEWYASLFADAAPGDLRGESSTDYTKLPDYPRALERMKATVPDAKLIYMMRHPIDRLISHYTHEQLVWRMQIPIDEAIDKHPELIWYGCYGMQIEPYLDAYGPENVLPIFFERFIQNGPDELRRVCRFLGSPREPQWVESHSAMNVSSERMRANALRDRLVNSSILTKLRRRFVPKSWRNRIRKFWQIKSPPLLSPQTLRRLEETFDADLARLGSLLNLPLSCQTFRDVARENVPEWSYEPKPSVVEPLVE